MGKKEIFEHKIAKIVLMLTVFRFRSQNESWTNKTHTYTHQAIKEHFKSSVLFS